MEDIIGTPVIYAQPASRTNNGGSTASFNGNATGTSPLSYRWLKDGTNLANGGNVSGASVASLTLGNVLGGDAGLYSVVITNVAGSVTSAVATLTVIEPVIILQPTNQIGNAGDNLTLAVVVAGTPPLNYQWRKDGLPRAGATQSSLTLNSLQASDAGSYDVAISNRWGSLISSAALLSVNFALPDSFDPGANGSIQALAVQPDGKILVGGDFTVLGGQNCTGFGRLDSDGKLDTNFSPGLSPSMPACARSLFSRMARFLWQATSPAWVDGAAMVWVASTPMEPWT